MLKKLRLVTFIIILCLVCMIAFLLYASSSPRIFEPSRTTAGKPTHAQPAPASKRQLDSGIVIGVEDSYNTYAWLGMPYAAPPIGDLRWRAPRPVTAWNEPMNATVFGHSCIQPWSKSSQEGGMTGDIVGNEDCLFLNVWSPRQSIQKKLPVMVWIHGGGNVIGSSSAYPGHNLAGNKDVIVVVPNYRLGVLGWFSHQFIRESADNAADASGNFGTLDTIAALEWVQRNISVFGGDSKNVTIFGESAGGKNVYALIASPLAKGLFHKAIVQSGTTETFEIIQAEAYPGEPPQQAISGFSASSAAIVERVALEHFGGESESTIRAHIASMTSNEILDLMKSTPVEKLMHLIIGIGSRPRIADVIQDGYVIPKSSTLDLLQDPEQYQDVPLMLGTTKDEQKAFMSFDPEFVNLRLGLIPEIRDPIWYQTISDYASRTWKAGSVDEPAERITKHGKNAVFGYRFDWSDLPSNFIIDLKNLLGAPHGMDVPFVFGDFSRQQIPLIFNRSNADGRQRLSSAMMDYWTAFAHHGNPGRGLSGTQPEWTPWQPTGKNLMLLDNELGVGIRMAEVRNRIAELKQRIVNDKIIVSQRDKCRAFALLFLHGYQADDYWNSNEYNALGCESFPVWDFSL